jgi:CHAT domain-containing protein
MSACDSGRGKITGDGVIGLSRGYLAAGVPSVMVSLWPVSDRSTAILMVNFYQGLKSGQSKAASLRSAMLKNRERFQEPKLWAPFVIYGAAN